MVKDYFGLICESVLSNERMQKFVNPVKDDNKVILKNNEECYEITYDEDSRQVKLNLVDEDFKNIKNLSSWLLDKESATQKDVNMITKDFVDTMAGKEKSKNKSIKRKNKAENESNITGLFFANRMVNIFPELKEEIQNEKNSYEEFRSVMFAEKNILPKVQELLKSSGEKALINKLGKLLNDLYKNGTLDVRSIITMVILNNIEEQNSISAMESVLSDELKKAWSAALKYKGKNVKPEKVKTRKSLLSKALEVQKMQQ